ncbi:hypothetical protein F511_44784 [Dorcoceras hygrometricum]|uniref:Copia protein n=1 Tax=Dorcoceras hygrometricum TaxID=472368 RepID=A0A2Z7A553_9LAMI|nr:hypothetical protein F511_44784 [Dorcoceras hygrometricum]
MWLQRLMRELKMPVEEPVMMFCDNQSTISIAKNPVRHDRKKHVEIDRHFIKEKIEALPRKKFEDLRSKLGLINIYKPA